MPTVGEQLRTAREARGLSVHQAAEVTKIRTDHLRALEEANFGMFTAPVYIKGFTRSYATLLKLDVPSLMRQLEAELGGSGKFSEAPAHGRQGGMIDFVTLHFSRLSPRAALSLILGVVILVATVAALFLWNRAPQTQTQPQIEEGLYRPGGQKSGETLPVPRR